MIPDCTSAGLEWSGIAGVHARLLRVKVNLVRDHVSLQLAGQGFAPLSRGLEIFSVLGCTPVQLETALFLYSETHPTLGLTPLARERDSAP